MEIVPIKMKPIQETITYEVHWSTDGKSWDVRFSRRGTEGLRDAIAMIDTFRQITSEGGGFYRIVESRTEEYLIWSTEPKPSYCNETK